MIHWDEKLGKIIDLERKLKDLSMESKESKITQMGYKYIEKSNREVRERKLFIRRHKIMKN